jgi:dCMP deaminase
MGRILSWDEYFMGVAKLSGLRSKDPNTQVGCCIVNQNKKIVAVGYNGMPMGCNDKDFPWDVKEGSLENTKYAYVVHAELNAILNSTQQLCGCTIYVSLFPCNECSKAIIQSGIKEIVYADDKYFGTPSFIASRRMLEASGVKVRQVKDIKININED